MAESEECQWHLKSEMFSDGGKPLDRAAAVSAADLSAGNTLKAPAADRGHIPLEWQNHLLGFDSGSLQWEDGTGDAARETFNSGLSAAFPLGYNLEPYADPFPPPSAKSSVPAVLPAAAASFQPMGQGLVRMMANSAASASKALSDAEERSYHRRLDQKGGVGGIDGGNYQVNPATCWGGTITTGTPQKFDIEGLSFGNMLPGLPGITSPIGSSSAGTGQLRPAMSPLPLITKAKTQGLGGLIKKPFLYQSELANHVHFLHPRAHCLLFINSPDPAMAAAASAGPEAFDRHCATLGRPPLLEKLWRPIIGLGAFDPYFHPADVPVTMPATDHDYAHHGGYGTAGSAAGNAIACPPSQINSSHCTALTLPSGASRASVASRVLPPSLMSNYGIIIPSPPPAYCQAGQPARMAGEFPSLLL